MTKTLFLSSMYRSDNHWIIETYEPRESHSFVDLDTAVYYAFLNDLEQCYNKLFNTPWVSNAILIRLLNCNTITEAVLIIEYILETMRRNCIDHYLLEINAAYLALNEFLNQYSND